MKIYCVIPTYNEEAFIAQTLHSLVQQTVVPDKIVVVNDNSTDRTAEIIADFEQKYANISQVFNESENKHLPGSKVIRAFNKGFETLDDLFDIIVKLDADLILPPNYFERIIETFNKNNQIGMVGGFAYIEKNNEWILESLTDKDHIRGAFKAYRKECFEQIGGLKPAMGWDTVDELLCRFYNWQIITLPDLKVKHLKPTGATYDQSARYKQGEAFYTLGYGFWITAIASIKLALRKQKPLLFIDYLKGFFKAKQAKKPLLVTKEQAKFIRNYRWKKMKEKLF
ncbi:glycosyltransferase family 2 protein [Flavobacterium dauae]|uniref:glycosyltransferase family 2 protein n=1 Tax=Flavobacterium dauae TaxID=1563479 RepID=UPI00101B44F0|nr:glycosyltransferase family 2 protein [Flavobacterium dauae]WLD23443.1 glycosyltransferase family 2 protein [Flavobacterium dauae]